MMTKSKLELSEWFPELQGTKIYAYLDGGILRYWVPAPNIDPVKQHFVESRKDLIYTLCLANELFDLEKA